MDAATPLSDKARQVLELPELAPVRDMFKEAGLSLTGTKAEAVLQALRSADNRLQSEQVTVDGDGGPLAIRDLSAWRADWEGFCEVRGITTKLLESHGHGAVVREPSAIEKLVQEELHRGLYERAPNILALLAVDIPPELRIFLYNPEPAAQALALTDWRPNFSDDWMRHLWLRCAALEERAPGKGCALWIGISREPSPKSTTPTTEQPPHTGYVSRAFRWCRDFITKERF
ncbi:MAG: hypothetical protein EBZ48_03335 [Proteobacteria bacterium]|nr:hypothetical protein [Pseudomonadota bacterium]